MLETNNGHFEFRMIFSFAFLFFNANNDLFVTGLKLSKTFCPCPLACPFTITIEQKEAFSLFKPQEIMGKVVRTIQNSSRIHSHTQTSKDYTQTQLFFISSQQSSNNQVLSIYPLRFSSFLINPKPFERNLSPFPFCSQFLFLQPLSKRYPSLESTDFRILVSYRPIFPCFLSKKSVRLPA